MLSAACACVLAQVAKTGGVPADSAKDAPAPSSPSSPLASASTPAADDSSAAPAPSEPPAAAVDAVVATPAPVEVKVGMARGIAGACGVCFIR